MPELLLGIDVGTTGVRGALYDPAGKALAEAAVACPYQAPAPGFAEADPDAWWRVACDVVRRLGDTAPLDGVAAVGVTGQAPTVILVDDAGAPLRPAILWLDTRAAKEARGIDTALSVRLGGNRMHAYFAGPKLAWVARHEPDLFARAARLVQSHAYVASALTGETACDYSTAALCAPLFDAARRAWSDEGARAVGAPERFLPPLLPAHAVLGAVTAQAASATGLRAGTRVVAGGGDFAASALGAGVVEEGEACLMLGTAGNLLAPRRSPRFDSRLINAHHVGCDRWLVLGGTLCGAALEWFRRVAARGASFEELEAEAARVPPGAGGVLFLPYLQGERTPVWDEAARGVFAGLDLSHERGHLYRAVLEGIALGFRHCREVVGPVAEVVAANGAGKSALLRQILADALGAPLLYAPNGGGTVAGAAILAGLGAGLVADVAAGRAWRGEHVRHEPDANAGAVYDERFAARLALYEGVRAEHP
jgi:xylulokinase